MNTEIIRYKKINDFVEEVKKRSTANSALGYPNDEAYNKAFREALKILDGRFSKRETDRILKHLEPLKDKYFPKEDIE